MNCFDADHFLSLENTIKQQAIAGNEDALDDLGFLKKAVLSFARYVYMVAEERIEVRLAKGVKTGDDLRDTLSHFDTVRHNAHEAAIANTNMLNRIASAYRVEHVFTGDAANRSEVGEFCGEITAWLFENRYS